MTPQERIHATLLRKPVDRIPVDVWLTPEVLDSLKADLGQTDELELYRDLGVDKIVWVFPGYGTDKFDPNDGEGHDPWGVPLRKVQSGKATYMEYGDPPLGDMEEPEELADYPLWPDPDGSEALRFVVETARQPTGPYAPLPLRAADLAADADGWTLALPRVNQLARHLRINGGPATRISTGESSLHLQLQTSHDGPDAMQPVPAGDWSVTVEDGSLVWRGPAATASARWFRLLAIAR